MALEAIKPELVNFTKRSNKKMKCVWGNAKIENLSLDAIKPESINFIKRRDKKVICV